MERLSTCVSPNPTDVLLGRGTHINDHAGNIRFRQLISARKAQYLSLSRNHDKDRLAREIGKSVLSTGGRFLKKKAGVPPTKKVIWELAKEQTVILKVKQAMRDNYRKDRIHSHSQQLESLKPGTLPSGSPSQTTGNKTTARYSTPLSRYTSELVDDSYRSAEQEPMQLHEATLGRLVSISQGVSLSPDTADSILSHTQSSIASLSLARFQQFPMTSPASHNGPPVGNKEHVASSTHILANMGKLDQERNQRLQQLNQQLAALLAHQRHLRSLRLLAIHRQQQQQQQQLLLRVRAYEDARSGL